MLEGSGLVATEKHAFLICSRVAVPLESPPVVPNGLIDSTGLPMFLSVTTEHAYGNVHVYIRWLGQSPFPPIPVDQIYAEISVSCATPGLIVTGVSDDSERPIDIRTAPGDLRLRVVFLSEMPDESYAIFARTQPVDYFFASDAAYARFSPSMDTPEWADPSAARAVGEAVLALSADRRNVVDSGEVTETVVVRKGQAEVHNYFVGFGWSSTFDIGPEHIGIGRAFYQRSPWPEVGIGGLGAVHVLVRSIEEFALSAQWQWVQGPHGARVPVTEMLPLQAVPSRLVVSTSSVGPGETEVRIMHDRLPTSLVPAMHRFWAHELGTFVQRLMHTNAGRS